MRYLSLFSGIGAFESAFGPLGWECVGQSEVDPFACAVLDHHFQTVPNFGDITQLDPAELGAVDLVCGGWPCQDHSIAGKRAGLDGEKSGLFHNAVGIIHELRRNHGLRWAVLENVPGLFSDDSGRAFARVAGALVGCHPDVPRDGWQNSGAALGKFGMLEWRALDGQHFGPPQQRKRVFIVVDFGDWENRKPVLLERDSDQRNDKKSTEAQERFDEDGCSLGFFARAGKPIATIEYLQTITTSSVPCVHTNDGDRFLTPREVSRCFGFPDSYLESVTFRNRCPPPDTSRYQALGNSIVVPVARWIGGQIDGLAYARPGK